MSKFTVEWRVVADGYINRMDNNDNHGGGAYRSYASSIFKDGEEYLGTIDYVERLNSRNTKLQDAVIRDAYTYRTVVEHDVEPENFPIPPKTQSVLDALNQAAEQENSDG